MDVAHQVHEHRVGFVLVLDEGILLPPRAIADGVPQLIEIVKVILPLLVQHVQHHQRQQLVREFAQARELLGERLPSGVDTALFRFLLFDGKVPILEAGDGEHVMHEEILPQQREIPLLR